ncbi:MAG: hypothetical protein ABSF21_04845 [Dehalococcoidia bacterium]
MKHKLISVALIAILLFMVLGNSVGCTPTTNYTLTMSSTAGGSVTPAVGAHNYSAGTVVNLTATADSGYRFVNWTGGGADIGNATAATTTITMNADHTVSANFALGVLIANVPDTNQPPTNTIPTPNRTNFCAPIAMANILEYWDDVANHANAQNVTAGLIPETVAEYLGWFMDTNNAGSPDRTNAGFPGTKDVDIVPGTLEFVRWDAAHNPPGITAPPFALPAGKLGYNWSVLTSCDTNYTITLNLYKNEINNGRPLVVSFDYWNPVFGTNVTDPQSGQTISVFGWGTPTSSSHTPNPEESWFTSDIGHAVTGVGYILNWDPDGVGGLPQTDYVIVHDNWATTPENVAVPWANWMCLFPVSP